MKPRIAITVGSDEVRQGNMRQTYRDAVAAAGGDPVLVGPVASASVPAVLGDFDGLLLPGGTDVEPSTYGGQGHPSVDLAHPDRDALELEAARFAKRSGLPMLAICRGMQVVNVALGGTLFEDVPDQYEPANGLKLRHYQTPDFSRKETTHDVDVKAGSMLAQIAGAAAIATNSMHHQAVRRIAHGLEPVAHARDGIVEALELSGEHPFFIAVQWHPEELYGTDEPSRRLFARFVEAAARRAHGRSTPAAR
jgi:putative glutamine amidotransferase